MGIIIIVAVVVIIVFIILRSLLKNDDTSEYQYETDPNGVTKVIYIGKSGKLKNDIKQEYEQALQGTNKMDALTKGRKYYATLRSDGKLTAYDETAIANDIATMKS